MGAITMLLANLRGELKRKRLTAKVLAERMGVAEPTMRRWLHGKGLTLERLEQLCELVGVALGELAGALPDHRQTHFTHEQERVLAANRALAFLFFSILNGAQPDSFQRDFKLPKARVNAYVDKLHRLGLIDRSADRRVRPLTTRSIAWSPGGPLAKAFESTVRHFFLSMDFGAREATYAADMVNVSALGRARIHALFATMRLEIHKIAAEDQAANLHHYDWHAVLMLVHPLDLTEVSQGAEPTLQTLA